MATSLLTITESKKLFPNAPLLSPLPGTLRHRVGNNMRRDRRVDKASIVFFAPPASANWHQQNASAFLRRQRNVTHRPAEVDADQSVLKDEPCFTRNHITSQIRSIIFPFPFVS